MAFENLLGKLVPQGGLRDAIDRLLARKRLSAEVEDGPRIPEISDFLEFELNRMEANPLLPETAGGEYPRLDDFFRSVLR